jgi:protocatechuate 3,4-dioxygenase beta subunit
MSRASPGTRAARFTVPAVLFGALLLPCMHADPTMQGSDVGANPDARRIRGRVIDEAGQPVDGAVVRVLRKDLSSDRRDTQSESWIDPTVVDADEDGLFSADDLQGAAFVVRAEVPDRAPTTVENVPPGAWVSLRARPGHGVRGRVIDAGTRRPVAAASVLACDTSSFAFGREACARTETGEDGGFVLTGQPVGEIQLRAHAAGYAVSAVRSIQVPAVGGDPGVTLEMRHGARISGRVVDERRRPVSGARVYVRPLAGSAADLADAGTVWPSHTDDEGAFVFPGIPSGARFGLFAHRSDRGTARGGTLAVEPGVNVEKVEILLPSAARLALRLVDESDEAVDGFELFYRTAGERPGAWMGPLSTDRIEREGEGRYTASVTASGTYDLLIAPQDLAELRVDEIRLEPGRTTDLQTLTAVRGLSLRGRVSDPSGESVEHATVQVTWHDALSARSRRDLTGENGRYHVDGLDEVPVRVVASADGFVSVVREEVLPEQRDVDLTLRATGALTGRVELEEGTVPEAFLIVTHVEADGPPGSSGQGAGFPRRESFADEDGSYRIDDLPPGRYTVEARAAGHAPGRRKGIQVTEGAAAEVPVIELEKGLTLEGRVVAADDETPVHGAEVEGFKAGGSLVAPSSGQKYVAATDEDGRFGLEGLEAGPLVVQARHPRFARAEERLEIRDGAEVPEVVLRLPRGGTLTGTVRDATGEPAPARSVVVTRDLADRDAYEYATTDMDGRYELTRLAPGGCFASVVPRLGETLSAKFENVVIREGEVTVLDFDETSRITLEGTVFRDGEPLRRAQLFFAKTLSLTDLRFAATDATGAYEIGLDEPGRYRVLLQTGPLPVSGGASAEITVPDREHVRQDIHLGSDGVTGRVTDTEGRPVVGAVVSATAEGAPASAHAAFLVAETDAEGRYAIQGLHEGTYRLTASAPGFRIGSTDPVGLAEGSGVVVVDIRLESGSLLRGRLIDDFGGGIPGAAILVAPSGSQDTWGTGAATALTDVNGTFRLTAPGDGPIDVTALPNGWAPARLIGVVPPEGEDELVVRASRGGNLRIQVVGPEGAPRHGIRVSARPVLPYLGSDLALLLAPPIPTDAAGATVLRHLAPGPYAISVTGYEGLRPAPVTIQEAAETLARVELP